MIPQFPEFKKLELSDKEDVEKFTKQFPPYSDFNFVSMWSWDINGIVRISQLNENLVVKFSDYLTGDPFYSFLGINNVNETARLLIKNSKKEGITPKLKLLPEEVVDRIDMTKFLAIEDRDHFDYIYTVDSLMRMDHSKFYVKRKHFRFFQKNFNHSLKQHDNLDILTKEKIIELFKNWGVDKDSKLSAEYFEHEFKALNRFLDISDKINFLVVGIYFEEKLIAAGVSENVESVYYNLSHFQKAINSMYKGVNAYLINELAKILYKKGIVYINWEQDLGILGLRENKESYLPTRYLKKYSLSTLQNLDNL